MQEVELSKALVEEGEKTRVWWARLGHRELLALASVPGWNIALLKSI